MLLNIITTVKELPMVWDFIIPLAIILVFCVILFGEGEFGKSVKKRFHIGPKDSADMASTHGRLDNNRP